MFFQEAPPDTSAYMVAGYVIFFILMAVYLISLLIRSRNLRQDLTMLETMQQENRAIAESKTTPVRKKASKAAPVRKKTTNPKTATRRASKAKAAKTARPKPKKKSLRKK